MTNSYTGTIGDDRPLRGPYDVMFGLEGNDVLETNFSAYVILAGGSGNDLLRAEEGSGAWGILSGGDGNDVVVGCSSAYVSSLQGGAGDDWLGAGDGADVLDGGDGRDELAGGSGNDTIYGGDGDDSGAATTVGPYDWTSYAGLYGGWGDDFMDGGSGQDYLEGGRGNDTLIGGTGDDTLVGSEGDDFYIVDSASDVIVEAPDFGRDTVLTNVSYTLQTGVSVEILEAGVGTTAISLVGNEFSNTIIGNSGANRLSGGTGNDSLLGGFGNDALTGGAGNDVLTGGRGRDQLTGGLGKDRFVFDDRDTGASKASADTILDFRGRYGDRIDLRLVDANAKAAGDQAFSFIGKAAFTEAGQVRYEKTGSYTYVYLNTDADAAAEAVIRLKGAMDLAKGWFLL